MQLRFQYARASDGIGFPFTAFGNGPPLVFTTAAVFGDLAGEMQLPDFRVWTDKLALRHTLVFYEGRSGPISELATTDLSLEGHVSDIEAVIDRLGLETFDLFGFYHTSLAAIVYAARHPEKVRKLILWHSYAKASDQTSPQLAAVRSIRDTSWEVFTETLARTSFGWTNDEGASRWARMIRESTTPARVARWLEFQKHFDVTEYLPLVRCPTLLMYRKDARRFSADMGISLASQIPGAQLQLLPGDARMYFAGDSGRVIDLIEEFLDDSSAARTTAYGTSGSIVTILFVQLDPDGSVDDGGPAALADTERVLSESVRRHRGGDVRPMADGFVASFSSAQAALECAIELQRAVEGRQALGGAALPRLRAGLNAGEPMTEHDDLFGSDVILAARTASKATAGEILVTDVVRQLAAGKGFLFSDLGETEMRGFEDPVRLFELGWRRE